MLVSIKLNGKIINDNIDADMLLIDFVRKHGCLSVKRGCETSNCFILFRSCREGK